ncbi:hypothetical protein PXH69_24610 [Rhodococcus qingshengii]|uniref:Uncharacterized protein n=1 Tax=Rhodococcus qingshengii TaxID=334542 RepID=A0AAW6LMC8_RHOSG|nr:hypothetical protein [Rhodococcus qingshengii]MDE8648154.1 hypothetical protein [Rhodococcus qingshengii]
MTVQDLAEIDVKFYLKYARELVDAGLWEVMDSSAMAEYLGISSTNSRQNLDKFSTESRQNLDKLPKLDWRLAEVIKKSKHFSDTDDIRGFRLKSWDSWNQPINKLVEAKKRGRKPKSETVNEVENTLTGDPDDASLKSSKSNTTAKAVVKNIFDGRAPAERESPTAVTQSITEALFTEWWTAYPRKVGKAAAKKAFEKALKKIEWPELHSAVIRFSADPNLPTDKNFIPHPSTWLNEGRWDDEPLPPRYSQPIKKSQTQRAQEILSQPNPAEINPPLPEKSFDSYLEEFGRGQLMIGAST